VHAPEISEAAANAHRAAFATGGVTGPLLFRRVDNSQLFAVADYAERARRTSRETIWARQESRWQLALILEMAP